MDGEVSGGNKPPQNVELPPHSGGAPPRGGGGYYSPRTEADFTSVWYGWNSHPGRTAA